MNASVSPATGGNAPTTAQDIGTIHDLLNDDGFLGKDRNDHLHRIDSLLQGLNPDQLNKVLSGLSSADLKKYGDQIDAGGIFGMQGLSADEKKNAFTDIAKNADGTQLGRFSQALGRDDRQSFAQQVAQFATPANKVDYIKSLAAGTTNQDDKIDTGIGSTSTTSGSPDARAAATVLGSLNGASFDSAMHSLNAGQFSAVMKAAEQQTMTTTASGYGGAATTISNDVKPLTGIVNAAASSNDPAIKAQVFESAASALKDIKGSNTLFTPNLTAGDQAKQVTDAMTNLLRSDTNGVVNALNTDQPTAHAMSAYMKEMLAEGRTSDIGGIIKQLQQGNDLSQNPVKYLDQTVNDPNGQPYYKNAMNLGYVIGSVQAAVNSTNSDTKAQGDRISNIFNTVASVSTVTAGPAGKVGTQVFNGLTKEVVSDVVSQMQSGEKSLRDAMVDLSVPHDPKTHQPVVLASEPTYEAKVAYIASVNQ